MLPIFNANLTFAMQRIHPLDCSVYIIYTPVHKVPSHVDRMCALPVPEHVWPTRTRVLKRQTHRYVQYILSRKTDSLRYRGIPQGVCMYIRIHMPIFLPVKSHIAATTLERIN